MTATAPALRGQAGAGRAHQFGILLALHLPLGVILAGGGNVTTLHALITLAVGIAFAANPARPDRVAYVVGYIAGADVLWRMTGAAVFHQFGKYSIALITSLALMRGGTYRHVFAPALYLILLLPSIALVQKIAGYNPGIIGSISFNLSGPIALACSVAFFRQIELSWRELTGVLLATGAATIAVFVVALRSTLLAGSIHFTGESNFVTSGGFGPNQVSAILGLGALVFCVAALVAPRGMCARTPLWVAAMALTVQCLLTLSRGGIYAAVGALLLALPFLATDQANRGRILARIAAVGVLIVLLAVPLLDSFTGGALLERFGDRRLAGRGLLMMRDLAVWQENPIFGVGPGMSKLSRVEGFNVTLAHTEFTRLVSEHGLLGVLSLGVLIGMSWVHVRNAPQGMARFVAAVLCAWSFLFMVAVAFRLGAPAFCLGLSAVLVRAPPGQRNLDPDPEPAG